MVRNSKAVVGIFPCSTVDVQLETCHFNSERWGFSKYPLLRSPPDLNEKNRSGCLGVYLLPRSYGGCLNWKCFHNINSTFRCRFSPLKGPTPAVHIRLTVAGWSPNPAIVLLGDWYTYEKSVGVLQLLVPRPEALALPTAVRTSNAEAHADMYIAPLAYLLYNKVYRRLVNTHPWTSTAAMFFDSLMNLARFQIVKNKALSKRLIHKSIPTVKSLLMSNFFPPSAGFCIASQTSSPWLHPP